MSEELKPIRCGCGGEAKVQRVKTLKSHVLVVMCTKCEIATNYYTKESEAIQAWNEAMSGKDINVPIKERTTRVECIAEVYKDEIVDHYLSGICGICGESTYDHAKYCSDCGAKLEWS